MTPAFEGLDGSQIEEFGRDVVFTPAGGSPEDVRVIKVDPLQLAAAGIAMSLFGTLEDSGFSQAPAKGDSFTIDGEEYRVFQVLGPDDIGGYSISLDRDT